MRNFISLLLCLTMATTLGFAQAGKITVQPLAGIHSGTVGLGYSIYDDRVNDEFPFNHLIVVPAKPKINAGLLVGYHLNDWQSLKSGLWFENYKYQIQVYGPSTRVDFFSQDISTNVLRVPLLYSHRVADIGSLNCKMNFNVGTSLTFVLQEGYTYSETVFAKQDTFTVTQSNFNSVTWKDFPLITGLEFQFYNKDGKEHITVNFQNTIQRVGSGSGVIRNELSYIYGNKRSDHMIYQSLNNFSLSIGYTIPVKKANVKDN